MINNVKGFNFDRYALIIKSIAKELKIVHSSSLETEELINTGWVGLMKAIRDYKPGFRASLETYARIKIRGEITHEIEREPNVIFISLEKAGFE